MIYVNHNTFHLTNGQISYIIGIHANGQPGALYFGAAVRQRDDFMRFDPDAAAQTAEQFRAGKFRADGARWEYPAFGTGDFRTPAFELWQDSGSHVTVFKYVSHEVFAGKRPLAGLPATYCESDGEAETLELTLRDDKLGATLILSYTIFRDYPAVARSAKFINGGEAVRLRRAFSASIDLAGDDFDLITMSGLWARECYVNRRSIARGTQGVYSMRGASSSSHNPFMALARHGADEVSGEVYGFSLVYSGNHVLQADVDSFAITRVSLGINPQNFEWTLGASDSFTTPEAVLVYSNTGLGGMSRAFHSLYGRRLARGVWRDKPRPVLINNWEGTYFNFNESKLLDIARAAADVGVELFVLDDGWFGKRDDDHSSLGDWFVYTDKLPCGIGKLADGIRACGLKFGLWFEPEMVSPDSDLFREHPDWALASPQRRRTLGRNQCVLDFSRPAVVDRLFNMMDKVIIEAKLDYIKWDMNRNITECWSAGLPPERQGEVYHRYILGVYSLYERLIAKHPNVLFESCASGGGRFDPGILHYAPQGWTSDDTDAIERLKIQYGVSHVYPQSCWGAHVSAVPNHQTGRVTSLSTRAAVAYTGAFGYELDMSALSKDDRDTVRAQVTYYKERRELFQFGEYHRLSNPHTDNVTAWLVLSPDKRRAILVAVRVLNVPATPAPFIRLRGLDASRDYTANGEAYGGDELMNAGIRVKFEYGDFSSAIIEFEMI